MSWSENDLKKLKEKGFTVDDKQNSNCGEIAVIKPKTKIEKVSIEKNTIEFILKAFVNQGKIQGYVNELKFLKNRKFRFDWAIPSLMIAIEYEGIFSEKSGHTTITGYASDIEKYNLAQLNGWMVLRYTALNYSDLANDLQTKINNNQNL